ncbi:MAG TPA: hypothetical protein VFL76_11070 [Edaphocola sp.]|nr:hypothetical protein [Edaphocola sp.]
MKTLFFFTFLLVTPALHAQTGNLSEIPGKITGLPANGTFKGISGKIFEAARASKTLARPAGFEAGIYTGAGIFEILLFNYTVDKTGSIKKVDEAPANIRIYLNPKDFFTRNAGFFDDYDEKLKIPHPFQRIPAGDSTADYVEYSFKNYPFNAGTDRDFAFRVLRGNNKPVFIPFTRKEYVQYLIAKEQLNIKNNEKSIAELKKDILQSQKNLKEPVYKDIQKTIEDGIRSMGNNISKIQAEIVPCTERISKYKDLVSKMSPGEAQAVAYVDVESHKYVNSDLQYLVPYGRKEGWPLYIVNPDYYDPTQPPSKPQAMIVTYWYWNGSPQEFCPDFLKERTKEIFESIDYHKLKESLE